jgi:hypothetical protein
MQKRIGVLVLALTLSVLLLNSLARGDFPDVLRVSFIDVGQRHGICSYASEVSDSLIAAGRRSPGPAVAADLQGAHEGVPPEWCGLGCGSRSAVWNDSGDCADMRDSCGEMVRLILPAADRPSLYPSPVG